MMGNVTLVSHMIAILHGWRKLHFCTGHILSHNCLELMMQNDYYEMFKLSTWQSYARIYVSIAVHIACGAYICTHGWAEIPVCSKESTQDA